MTSALEIVQSLDDNQTIMMVKEIHNKIFSAIDFETVEKNLSDKELGNLLLGLNDEQLNAKFDAKKSVLMSQQFLESIAHDENFSTVITETWETIQNDDSMFVGTIIAVGLIANLTLFMVSSKFEIEIGGAKFKKEIVDTDAIKAIMEPITELIKKM